MGESGKARRRRWMLLYPMTTAPILAARASKGLSVILLRNAGHLHVHLVRWAAVHREACACAGGSHNQDGGYDREWYDQQGRLSGIHKEGGPPGVLPSSQPNARPSVGPRPAPGQEPFLSHYRSAARLAPSGPRSRPRGVPGCRRGPHWRRQRRRKLGRGQRRRVQQRGP